MEHVLFGCIVLLYADTLRKGTSGVWLVFLWTQNHWEKIQAGSKEKKKEKESTDKVKESTEKIVSKHKEKKMDLLKIQTDFLSTHDKMQVCVCVWVCVCVCVFVFVCFDSDRKLISKVNFIHENWYLIS